MACEPRRAADRLKFENILARKIPGDWDEAQLVWRGTPGRGAGHGRELRKAFSRGPKHYCSQSGSLQIAERIALRARKNSCRQGTPEHRAGIEVQPVAAKIRDAVGLWRMPMNDQTAVIARVGKKWLPSASRVYLDLASRWRKMAADAEALQQRLASRPKAKDAERETG